MRFSFISDEELSLLTKEINIVNTTKATSWAVKKFEDRRSATKMLKENVVPKDLFSCSDKKNTELHFVWVCCRNQEDEWRALSTKTLYQILCGLLRHMRNINPDCNNFLDKKDNHLKVCIDLWIAIYTICVQTALGGA